MQKCSHEECPALSLYWHTAGEQPATEPSTTRHNQLQLFDHLSQCRSKRTRSYDFPPSLICFFCVFLGAGPQRTKKKWTRNRKFSDAAKQVSTVHDDCNAHKCPLRQMDKNKEIMSLTILSFWPDSWRTCRSKMLYYISLCLQNVAKCWLSMQYKSYVTYNTLICIHFAWTFYFESIRNLPGTRKWNLLKHFS